MVTHNPLVIEKRENPRTRFQGKLIFATTPELISITTGVVQDVSKGGFKVKVSRIFGSPFEKWNKVNFEITEDYFNLEGEGEITWISPDGGTAGIKFSLLDEENRRSLDHLLGMTPRS